MKKILRSMFPYFPQFLRLRLIRRMVHVAPGPGHDEFRVQIATNKDEFEVAFKLLHDCYVASRLMDPHPSGLRCNSFSFLPQTVMIVLKKGERVIGTVSLIRDSAMGLPSDEKYRAENDQLRAQGRVLTEVSSLAIDPEFRNQGHILNLMLMKYLYNYSRNSSDSDFLVCTLHPRAEDFYRALWGFRRKGDRVSYDYVKGAPAVFMFMELSERNERAVLSSYGSEDPQKNLGLYCLQEDARFEYPQHQSGQLGAVRMTPEILNYFFKIRTNLFAELNEHHRQIFYEIYTFHFAGSDFEEYFAERRVRRIREYRTPTRIHCRFKSSHAICDAKILDLSPNGCFLNLDSAVVARTTKSSEVRLEFALNGTFFSIEGRCTWRTTTAGGRHAEGIGIQFSEAFPQIAHELKKWVELGEWNERKSA